MQGDFLQETYEGGLKGVVRRRVEEFLSRQGLRYDKGIQYTVVLYDRQGEVAATGSLEKNVLKCIAVDEKWRGEGLTATVVSTSALPGVPAESAAFVPLYKAPQQADVSGVWLL